MNDRAITNVLYGVSASVLAWWLVLSGVPLIPVLAGIGIGAAIMVRLGHAMSADR